MRRLLPKAAYTAAATALMSGAHPADAHSHASPDSSLVTIATVNVEHHQSDIQKLASEGYNIAGIDLENGSVDLILDSEHDGLSLNILGFTLVRARTIDTKIAPDDRYKTPARVEAALRQVAEAYPNIVRMVSIGKTLQNRDIWALKISDNPDQRETDEPTILFNAMHHARELMTVEVALDLVDQLTSKYGSDPRTTHWVESNEIWVVPQINPDGNDMVWTRNNMWRKNARGGYGVDINRNYPYGWASCGGSSGNTRADNYRGASAASEPETQAVMELVARIQPVFNISYHSYSEIVIYPMGCQNQHTATREIVEPIGRELAGKLVRDSGRGTYQPGTSWELLYSVDGGDIDWMYAEHQVIPYVIEMNSSSNGFQPPYRLAQPTIEKMRLGWQYLLDRLDQSSVRGVVTDHNGRVQPNTQVTVERTAGQDKPLPATWKVKADSSYHFVLNPGTYRLKFAVGDRQVTKEVTIGAQRVELDVQL